MSRHFSADGTHPGGGLVQFVDVETTVAFENVGINVAIDTFLLPGQGYVRRNLVALFEALYSHRAHVLTDLRCGGCGSSGGLPPRTRNDSAPAHGTGRRPDLQLADCP